jgi:hypothetical protein
MFFEIFHFRKFEHFANNIISVEAVKVHIQYAPMLNKYHLSHQTSLVYMDWEVLSKASTEGPE